jgi:hypothetical protein
VNIRDRARAGFAQLPPGVRRQVLHGLGRYAPWEVGFDFTPPPLDDGDVTGPPEFVGIGVQKAGTTWWYDLICSHPMVSSREGIHKERHFFDRFGAQPMRSADIEDYHRWFPRTAGTMAGEWTPDYFTYPWVPRLLKRAAPDARLLLLLRDPVERFSSGLAHRQRMGVPCDGDIIADAVQRGFYDRALQGWLEEFDVDRFLILQLELCVADPGGQLQRTFGNLGLANYHPEADVRPGRLPSSTRAVLSDDVRKRLIELYAPDVAALAARLGEFDVNRWPNFAYLAGGGNPTDDSYSPTRRP